MIRIRSGDTVTELAWTGENIPAARLLAQAGLYPDYPCGGQGRCGKCRVLAHGDLSPAAPEELAQLPPRELARGMRLACLARICGPDAELTLPREDGLLVETGGSLHRLEWDPWAAALGICVDIGTTTVAAYLWDLDRRCRLGVASCKNPQERFGADVVSRLDASLAGQGDALRACIVRCLSDLAYQLCRQAGRPVSDVGGAVITGNTAMLYLLRGYDVRDIALAPFQARHLFGESVPARELGLDWGADCQVYLPPCLSAYVGADITCGLLACDILHARGPALLADVGTNGEMALLSDGAIYCCATAAGPAFEGVGISCGSAAVTGAIDAVTVEKQCPALSRHRRRHGPQPVRFRPVGRRSRPAAAGAGGGQRLHGGRQPAPERQRVPAAAGHPVVPAGQGRRLCRCGHPAPRRGPRCLGGGDGLAGRRFRL